MSTLPPFNAASAPLLFPNLGQSLPYQDGLRFCQLVLQTMPHGALRPWAESQGLNYTMIVNLKNAQLAKQTPLLVQRLLQMWGLPTQVFRRGKDAFIQCERTEDLARVQQQLAQHLPPRSPRAC